MRVEIKHHGTMTDDYARHWQYLHDMIRGLGITNVTPDMVREDMWDMVMRGYTYTGTDQHGRPLSVRELDPSPIRGRQYTDRGTDILWISDDGHRRIRMVRDERNIDLRNYDDDDTVEVEPHHEYEMPTVYVTPENADPHISMRRDLDGPDFTDLYYKCLSATYGCYVERYNEDPSFLFERVLRAYCGTTTFFRFENGDDFFYTFDTAEWRERTGGAGTDAREDFDDYLQWYRGKGITLVLETHEHGTPCQWVTDDEQSGYFTAYKDQLTAWAHKRFDI